MTDRQLKQDDEFLTDASPAAKTYGIDKTTRTERTLEWAMRVGDIQDTMSPVREDLIAPSPPQTSQGQGGQREKKKSSLHSNGSSSSGPSSNNNHHPSNKKGLPLVPHPVSIQFSKKPVLPSIPSQRSSSLRDVNDDQQDPQILQSADPLELEDDIETIEMMREQLRLQQLLLQYEEEVTKGLRPSTPLDLKQAAVDIQQGIQKVKIMNEREALRSRSSLRSAQSL